MMKNGQLMTTERVFAKAMGLPGGMQVKAGTPISACNGKPWFTSAWVAEAEALGHIRKELVPAIAPGIPVPQDQREDGSTVSVAAANGELDAQSDANFDLAELKIADALAPTVELADQPAGEVEKSAQPAAAESPANSQAVDQPAAEPAKVVQADQPAPGTAPASTPAPAATGSPKAASKAKAGRKG